MQRRDDFGHELLSTTHAAHQDHLLHRRAARSARSGDIDVRIEVSGFVDGIGIRMRADLSTRAYQHISGDCRGSTSAAAPIL